MQEALKLLAFLAVVFLLEGLFYNLLMPNRLPKLPGDIYINKPGITIYIPFVSALIISAILTIFFNFFQK